MARQIDHPHLCVFGQRQEHIPSGVARRARAMDEQDLGPLVAGLLHMPAHTTGLCKPAALGMWPIVAMRLPVHDEGLVGQLRPDGLAVTGYRLAVTDCRFAVTGERFAVTGSGLHHLCHTLAVGLGQGHIACAHGQRDLLGLRFGAGRGVNPNALQTLGSPSLGQRQRLLQGL